MATTVTENVDSREWSQGDESAVTLSYTIRGTDNDVTARDALVAFAPSTHDSLPQDEVTMECIWADTENSDGEWRGEVKYATVAPPEVGESTFSFDTGGGTQHITQSIETLDDYVAAGTAPDFKGAIGVTHDSVEGVDITVPAYSFSETHILSDATVTSAYKGWLFRLTGTTNVAVFRGLAIGECLFLGASGTQRGNGDWEITFTFAASANRTAAGHLGSITIGDITGIEKQGWDYMWVRYEDKEDPITKTIVKQPAAVYVEQVYYADDFSELGIGVS